MMAFLLPRMCLRRGMFVACLASQLVACATASSKFSEHEFRLVGGHFFGPGPIEPDTALPPGYLKNIRFKPHAFYGYADFYNDGAATAVLSDGKTRINQNIQAGVLEIGGKENQVLLVAVKGGPNQGREYYRLVDDYSMEWTVDLALDPGFSDGIVAVHNFVLTTGVIKIADSLQTEQGIPGGYDQAGSMKSGQYLAGRLGDFDQNGLLDGIVVAAPRVPLASNMLPGSPVGNQRGFETDVPVAASLACELTLRGIAQLQEPIMTLINSGRQAELVDMLKSVEQRIDSAQSNMERALIGGDLELRQLKKDGFMITDRMESLKTLNFILLSLVENYPNYGGRFSTSVDDAANKFFAQLAQLLDMMTQLGEQADIRLPKPKFTKTVKV